MNTVSRNTIMMTTKTIIIIRVINKNNNNNNNNYNKNNKMKPVLHKLPLSALHGPLLPRGHSYLKGK